MNESQCDRLLAVLADGEWVTTADLYTRAGGYIGALHSRIAELRARGVLIDSEHVPGETGAQGHRYRLQAPEGCCNAALDAGGAGTGQTAPVTTTSCIERPPSPEADAESHHEEASAPLPLGGRSTGSAPGASSRSGPGGITRTPGAEHLRGGVDGNGRARAGESVLPRSDGVLVTPRGHTAEVDLAGGGSTVRHPDQLTLAA